MRRIIVCTALLLALSGCMEDKATALNSCRIKRMEQAINAPEAEYIGVCMALRGYKFAQRGVCGGPYTYILASCYDADSVGSRFMSIFDKN